MAFQEIRKTQHNEKAVSRVKVSISAQGLAIFSISEDVFAQIGVPEYVRFLVGTGEDAGRVCLAAAKKERNSFRVVRQNSRAKQRRAQITAFKIGLPSSKRPAVRVPYEVNEHGLVLDVRSIQKPVLVAAE